MVQQETQGKEVEELQMRNTELMKLLEGLNSEKEEVLQNSAMWTERFTLEVENK